MTLKIFVTVGTHPQSFSRLLKALDKLIENGLKATIFAQTGHSTYKPKQFEFQSFIEDQQYDKKMQDADIIISHGGAGSIINALNRGKPLIVVPRLEKFKEHTNDHQLDLGRAMAAEQKCLLVEDLQGLASAIKEATKFKPKEGSTKQGLIEKLTEFIARAQ